MKDLNLSFVVIFVFSVLMSEAEAVQTAWQVGAAKINITPQTPVWLAGYDRPVPSTEAHDPVWARALSISNGETTIIILSADLIGLFKDDADEIRRNISSNKIPIENIIVTCTHNHNGPDVLGLWNADKAKSGVDSGYLKFVKESLISAARQAISSAVPARLYVARTSVEGISYNGRDREITDNSVVALFAENSDGKNIATLVNFACHPEVLAEENNKITSDYCHYLYQDLEKELGGTAMLVNGALGGMLTPLIKEHSFAEAERCGSTLARAVLQAEKQKVELSSGALKALQKKVVLEAKNPAFSLLYQGGIIHREFAGDQVETTVGAIKIGQLTIATIPGEALPKIGLEIKQKMRGKYKMIFGLANDELGYLIPGEDWRPDAYEESMSVGPEAGDDVAAAIFTLLKEVEK